MLLVPLLALLTREAPGLRLDLSLPTGGSSERLSNGELDLLLTPENFMPPDHPRELLFEERHVVVGWLDNPVMQRPMTKADFFSCGHVAVRISGRDTFIESALLKFADRRRIEVTAPSFIQAPWLLPGTQRLALMHQRLARLVAPALSLSIAESPVELPIMREMMQYHSTRANDAGLIWLRNRMLELANDA